MDMAKNPTDYAVHEHRPYGILIAGHYDEKPGYAVHRPSGSIDWLLMFTVSGEGAVRVNGETVACGPGDVTMLLPGMPHEYGTLGDHWEFGWAHFVPDPGWMSWLRLPGQDQGWVKIGLRDSEHREAVYEALARMVKHDGQRGSHLNERLAEVLLEEALLLLCLAQSAEKQPALDARIADLLVHLQNEYRAPVRIPDLARRCCLSPSRLSHLFKQQVGDTILNTVHKIRLEKAAELLAFTTRQVAEIAEDVGFGSADHFTRMFRSAYGKTPAEYRRAKRRLQAGSGMPAP